MNPDTGAIARFETDDDAKKAGYTAPLDEGLAEKMRQLSRADRRELFGVAQHPDGAGVGSVVRGLTRHHPLAMLAGMTDDDVRKLKNAAKRARRAR